MQQITEINSYTHNHTLKLGTTILGWVKAYEVVTSLSDLTVVEGSSRLKKGVELGTDDLLASLANNDADILTIKINFADSDGEICGVFNPADERYTADVITKAIESYGNKLVLTEAEMPKSK